MIELVVTLAVVGLVVWLIVTYIPMPPPFKTAILIITLICCIVFVLRAFGLWNGTVHDMPVPKIR